MSSGTPIKKREVIIVLKCNYELSDNQPDPAFNEIDQAISVSDEFL
jgi:hypothetical protein